MRRSLLRISLRWIPLGGYANLARLVKKYPKHLGQESFFEPMLKPLEILDELPSRDRQFLWRKESLLAPLNFTFRREDLADPAHPGPQDRIAVPIHVEREASKGVCVSGGILFR
jgi:hypothetical protein